MPEHIIAILAYSDYSNAHVCGECTFCEPRNVGEHTCQRAHVTKNESGLLHHDIFIMTMADDVSKCMVSSHLDLRGNGVVDSDHDLASLQ